MISKISLLILPLMILIILAMGMIKKVPIYEEFVEGAKDGFKVSISIIPYLVALIVAISMFRASGALDYFSQLLSVVLDKFSISADIVPIMFTRSLSGSATLGIFSELATVHGADDFVTKMAAVMVGSSETTFYVLTVYFGSVGIKKFRYSILTGIIADITGIVLAILVSRLFFLANIG
ncbi:MAG: spore maturation protein [bacterium]|nr:spore maturation protein [bacterium]